jgi:hypothetical protein
MKTITILLFSALTLFSSCGTICGGTITDCQRKGPGQGGIHRQIRPAALIFDILTFPVIGLVVDFVDGAMYVPCTGTGSGNNAPHHYNN